MLLLMNQILTQVNCNKKCLQISKKLNYMISHMNIHQKKNLNKKNKTSIHNFFQQVEEHIPHAQFFKNMNKLNDEQRFVVDVIIIYIYIYITQISFKTFTYFLNKRCKNRKKNLH
jgi:hypothetical protein